MRDVDSRTFPFWLGTPGVKHYIEKPVVLLPFGLNVSIFYTIFLGIICGEKCNFGHWLFSLCLSGIFDLL